MIRCWLFVFFLAWAAHAAPMGIMVPAYFYPSPGGNWNSLNSAAGRIPLIAIMNPASGPGSFRDNNYVTATTSLRAAGGKVIAYVDSDYANRDIALVRADVDQYIAWYVVDGFFIDQMTYDSNTNHLNYYSEIYQYIKSKGTNYSVTGNPGTLTQEAYLTRPTADILMVFENNTGYPGYAPSVWVHNYPAKQFVHVPYAVGSATTMSNYVNLARNRNAGWVFITDDVLPNPYDTLPAYWLAEVGLIEAINATNSPVEIVDPSQPADQSVAVGGSVTFHVVASGSTPLSFQWFKNGSPISGATNASYTNPSAQLADNAATYHCRVTNLVSSTNSRTATLLVNASASTNLFRTISIDGAFGDWSGVPPAWTQAQGSTQSIAFKDIYVANDNDYLYMRFTIYPPAANPFTSRQNLFIDTDNSGVTGYVPYFGATPYAFFASELLVQSGAGYQQKNGGYNEGTVAGLNWASAPAGAATDFEFRISRHATFASDGTAVFPANTIALSLESEDADFVTHNFAPTNGSGGLKYTFATPSGQLGPLSVSRTGNIVSVFWVGTGTLQARSSLISGNWTNLPFAVSPYNVPASNTQQYFRLVE